MSLRQIAALPRPLRFALGLAVGAILYATLQPADVPEHTPPLWCVACGERGAADFLLNVILFIPLGFVIRLAGARRRTGLLSGMFLSIFIELTQAFIPGRDTTLGDVIANTLGTLVGFTIAGVILAAARRRQPPIPSIAASLGLAFGVIALTGLALHPVYPPSVYYGQWTADLGGGLEWYQGHVLRANLGSLPLPSRQLDHQEQVRALLENGAPIEVTALAGPPPTRKAPLFSIYDDLEREMLMIAVERHDLVIRYWTRSLALGLERPYFTLSGALDGVRAGDTLHLALWRQHDHVCLTLDGRQNCSLAFTAGAGWSVLIYPESFGWWTHALLGALWVGGILLPVGFFATSRYALIAAGVATAVGLVVVPGLVGLGATPVWEWLGAALGVAGGWWGRRVAARIPAQPTGPASPQIVFTSTARQRSMRS